MSKHTSKYRKLSLLVALIALVSLPGAVDSAGFLEPFSVQPVGLRIVSHRTYYKMFFSSLKDWYKSDNSNAIVAFVRSCRKIVQRHDPESLLDPAPRTHGLFGRVHTWQAICRDAFDRFTSNGPYMDISVPEARRFFEKYFTPIRVFDATHTLQTQHGYVTAYSTHIVPASHTHTGTFVRPIVKVLENRVLYENMERVEIEQGISSHDPNIKILAYVRPLGSFELQEQGSGILKFSDGKVLHIRTAGHTNMPHMTLGTLLEVRGNLPQERASRFYVEQWLKKHKKQAHTLINFNPRVVFFDIDKEAEQTSSHEPRGHEGVFLTPHASLAVDHEYYALGTPIWVTTSSRQNRKNDLAPVKGLFIAQDTESEIHGAQRVDIFLGTGKGATMGASLIHASGDVYALVPKDALP